MLYLPQFQLLSDKMFTTKKTPYTYDYELHICEIRYENPINKVNC